MRTKRSAAEKDLMEALERAPPGPVSLRIFFKALQGRGKPLILLLLSLPFCLPLQIPGTSTLFGIAILFIGIRLAFGKKIWLPKFLLDKKISLKTCKKIFHHALWIINKLKKITRSRLGLICKHKVSHLVHGLFIALLGFFLALPLPIPLTNLIAAWGIFFVSLGLLEDDGLMILIGYSIIILCAFLIVLIF